MRNAKTLFASAAASVVLTLAPASHAEVGALVDWHKVLVDLDKAARGFDASRARESANGSRRTETREALDRSTPAVAGSVESAGHAWFGVAPRLTIVARDWRSSYWLAGDRLGVVDAMRLTESTRMVVGRFRASALARSRIVPFIQIGVGQWRTDPKLLPLTPRSMEIASQIGAGAEVTIRRGFELACETAATMLVRESREAGDVPQTRIFSASLAARLHF